MKIRSDLGHVTLLMTLIKRCLGEVV